MRSLGQKSACKNLRRNSQGRAITPEAAYVPVSGRPSSRSETRSLAQKSACKNLRRNSQGRAITPEATYTPTSNRASSRS
ncbi:ATP-dependent nuclease subunit B [Lacticaseibacillus chiayiensis]|nr:ATP-dependent nuclease subunit B [Lacticaseibacillus chiayiensis]